MKSQGLWSIILFRMAPGTATLCPHVSEKEVYDVMQFIYLSIYLSPARKNKKEIDT